MIDSLMGFSDLLPSANVALRTRTIYLFIYLFLFVCTLIHYMEGVMPAYSTAHYGERTVYNVSVCRSPVQSLERGHDGVFSRRLK